MDNIERRAKIQPMNIGLGKLPPQAPELEEAILGAIIIQSEVINDIVDIIKPDIFYKDAHRKIYEAIQQLYIARSPIDLLTLKHQLQKNETLEMVGGAYALTELTNRVASSANIQAHCRIVSEKFMQRELIRISMETIENAYNDSCDPLSLIETNQASVFSLMADKAGGEIIDIAELVTDRLMMIDDPEIIGLVGVGSGFIEIDNVTAGWRKSDLIIIAARPSMGKTALALKLARNAAIDFNEPALIFSLEMSKVQLGDRLLSSETGIKQDDIIRRTMSEYDKTRIHTVASPLIIEERIFIDDTAGISIFDMRAKARRMKQKHNIGIILIDYLQLMKGDQSKNGNREQEIASIARGLKGIAKELNIPVIALSQLNREVEKTANKRPNLSHLRESGAIEQDADMVIFLYRPEYYGFMVDEDNNPTSGVAELIIAKHRNGVCDTVKIGFNGSLMDFQSLEDNKGWDEPKEDQLNNFIIRPNLSFDDNEDESPF